MINGKSILAIIPARGGSRGVPRKNIKKLAGKPLIAWTIEEANKSLYIDRLILSSEDQEIIKIAREWGCEVPFVRPVELAQDDTPGIEPVIHAINTLKEKYDYVVLLQPTSPLRTVYDIDGCIQKCVNTGASACVSVTEVRQNPYWMYKIDKNMRLIPFVQNNGTIYRRQGLPKIYIINGAVYIAKTDSISRSKSFLAEDTLGYEMPMERSIDIDTEIDFDFCEWLIIKKIITKIDIIRHD